MAHLALVKSLSYLREEQSSVDEILIENFGLSLNRGELTEITGGASTGKTSFALSLLARLTSAGEVCAIVDACHRFDPRSACLAGVVLENLLWVRCGNDVEKAFLAADYLVQAKGFGAIWLNLYGLPENKLRIVPQTYWYRYRTRIGDTPTMLLVTAAESLTGSASQRSYIFSREKSEWSGIDKFKLLREFSLNLTSRKQFYGQPIKARIEMDYTDV